MANVFGALNRFISRLDSDSPAPTSSSSTRGAFGFQILRNTNHDLNVEPWFDFVIGINGRQIDNPDPALFASEVRNCAGSSVSLGLWSAKGQRVRSIYAHVAADTSSIGLSLQWTPLTSTEDVWHILDVAPNSPADMAGLLPYGDYIIGSPEGLVRGESGLGELVEDYLSRPLRLFVYNHEYDVTRLVTIQPSRSWGGSGALGCVLGFGALHRIPASLEEPPQGPGEMLFSSDRTSTDSGPHESGTQAPQYLVPAEIELDAQAAKSPSSPVAENSAQNPPATVRPPQGSAPPRREKKQHHAAKAVDMDAYFAEGEAKSREQDGGSSSPKPATSLAPPPKGGRPPRAASPLKEASDDGVSNATADKS